MAHVQLHSTSADHSATITWPCRRLRPRGRQRSSGQWTTITRTSRSTIALLSLLALVHLLGLVTATNTTTSGHDVHSTLAVKDNSGTPSTWRRMGLSETVTNNEQELINKILRDDTSSSSASASFQYTLMPQPPLAPSPSSPAAAAASDAVTPPGTLSASMPPSAVTNADTSSVSLPSPKGSPTAEPSQLTPGTGKINQSRSKAEQAAFNKSQVGPTAPGQSRRRRRRAVNVVVNTFGSAEQWSHSSSSSGESSVNSNFLLKSIVTGIRDCLKEQCRDKFHSLSTADIPQLLRNETSGQYVNVLDLHGSGLRTLPHRTLAAVADKLPSIEIIDLSGNQLKSADLALSGPLAFLNFSQNQLTRFQLRNGTVDTLDLSHNCLSGSSASVLDGDANDVNAKAITVVLGTRDCANVTMLDLSFNQLVDWSFLPAEPASCTRLRVLNLAHNKLQRITRATFATSPHLEILSLAENLVSEIGNDTFAHLGSLQYLDLSDNLLDASSVRALQGIPDLIGLSLARNRRLGDALQGFVASWSLKELDLSATGLCEIPAALAQSVRTLNLAHNHFQVRFHFSGDTD